MDISQNSEYVLTHPFLKEAIDNFNNGDQKDLKFILNVLQEDMYHKMLHSCNKTYKRFKHENFPIVEEEIKSTPPPDTLSIKLPIPLPKPECKVVPMQLKKVKIFAKKIANAFQLEFDFTKKGEPLQIAL